MTDRPPVLAVCPWAYWRKHPKASVRTGDEGMGGPVLQPEIHELIEQKNFSALKAAIRDMDVHDLVELLTNIEGEDLAVLFRLLPAGEAAEVELLAPVFRLDQPILFQQLVDDGPVAFRPGQQIRPDPLPASGGRR